MGTLEARRFLSLSAAAVVTLLAASSRGDERSALVRLAWTSDGGCLDAASVRTQVEDALGRSAFTDGDVADLVLVGHAGPTKDGFEAVVTLSRASGEALGTRTLSSRAARCDELSRGLPLALALMIDLPLREATVRVVPVVVRDVAVETEPTRAPIQIAPAARTPSRRHVALVAGPVLRLGWLPNVAAGVRLAAEVGIGPVHVGLEGTWVAPAVEDDGHVSARSFGVSGAMFACPFNAATTRVYGGACVYVEGGAIVADGLRAAPPRSDVAWLLSTGARVRGGLRWSSWTIGLEIGGGAFIVRPQLVYDRPGGAGSVALAEAWPGNLDIFFFAGTRFP